MSAFARRECACPSKVAFARQMEACVREAKRWSLGKGGDIGKEYETYGQAMGSLGVQDRVGSEEEASCTICQQLLRNDSSYEPGSTRVEILDRKGNDCGHGFHSACLSVYIKRGGRACPTCQKPIEESVLRRLGVPAMPSDADVRKRWQAAARRLLAVETLRRGGERRASERREEEEERVRQLREMLGFRADDPQTRFRVLYLRGDNDEFLHEMARRRGKEREAEWLVRQLVASLMDVVNGEACYDCRHPHRMYPAREFVEIMQRLRAFLSP